MTARLVDTFLAITEERTLAWLDSEGLGPKLGYVSAQAPSCSVRRLRDPFKLSHCMEAESPALTWHLEGWGRGR